MTLRLNRLTSDLSVSPQLEFTDLADAKAAGFASIISNRPDFEGGPVQPTAAQMAEHAAALGLQFAYLPVAPAVQSPEEIARFAELMQALPKPILAYCRSGARSSKLATGAFELLSKNN
jgi:uncharacterized protein (TIGR01244 family)